MSIYVGITDRDWYARLSAANAEEANFWRPGGSTFQRVPPGGLFLFKLKAPTNFIVGGGHFLRYLQMPISLAWKSYERMNGCQSEEELRMRLFKLKPEKAKLRDPDIGCILLAETFWFQRSDWIPAPTSWHPRIQSGIGYDAGQPEYRELLEAVRVRLGQPRFVRESASSGTYDYVAHARIGQGAFRALVTEAYQRRCAVTGERTLPALDAAHIKPFALCGEHRLSNGIVLRADLHRLFDEGLVTISPDLNLLVSKRIKEEYANGRDYYALGGRALRLPAAAHERPDPAILEWHNNTRYQG